MTGRPTVELGSFVVGELPLPLDYQFLDADGVPIDLSGFGTVQFQWGTYVLGQFLDAQTETAFIGDAVAGVVTYAWDGDEFATTGPHAGQFWVDDGVTRYASCLITWQVCASVGVAP